jgi:hypothetical protein
MYNLNYTPTTLGVQSWREIISGGTRTKKLNTTGLKHNAITKVKVKQSHKTNLDTQCNSRPGIPMTERTVCKIKLNNCMQYSPLTIPSVCIPSFHRWISKPRISVTDNDSHVCWCSVSEVPGLLTGSLNTEWRLGEWSRLSGQLMTTVTAVVQGGLLHCVHR